VIGPAALGGNFAGALRACATLEAREELAKGLAGIAFFAQQRRHVPSLEERALLRELLDETLGLARTLRAVRKLLPKAYVALDKDDVFELSLAKHDDEKTGPRVPIYVESARFAAGYRPRPLPGQALMAPKVAATKQSLDKFEQACQHNHLTCVVLDESWSGTAESLAARLGERQLERLRGLAKQ